MHLWMSTSFLSMSWPLLCLTLCYAKSSIELQSRTLWHSHGNLENCDMQSVWVGRGQRPGVPGLRQYNTGAQLNSPFISAWTVEHYKVQQQKCTEQDTPPPPMGPPSVKKQALFTQKLLLNCLTIKLLSLFLLCEVMSNLICCDFVVTLK